MLFSSIKFLSYYLSFSALASFSTTVSTTLFLVIDFLTNLVFCSVRLESLDLSSESLALS